jgi:hypothetical protein
MGIVFCDCRKLRQDVYIHDLSTMEFLSLPAYEADLKLPKVDAGVDLLAPAAHPSVSLPDDTLNSKNCMLKQAHQNTLAIVVFCLLLVATTLLTELLGMIA